MSRVFKQQTIRNSIGILSVPFPDIVYHRPGEPSSGYQRGTRWMLCRSSCLGCLNPTCMRFLPEELKLSDTRLSAFPADVDDAVCPLNAILWERGAQTPTIIAARCINCGICARRCPMGAIYSNGRTAVIHSGEPEVMFVPLTQESEEQHTRQIAAMWRYSHFGHFVTPDDEAINNLYKRLTEQQTEAQFPNLIIRNLFLALGNQCIIRRRGDVFFRIDAILSGREATGIVEVEFHKDSLESPRAILDDIAVLSSRYSIRKDEIIPFIVSLEFPNLRTEYWRVIKDIRDVLGVHINSLTLGALCMMTWSFVDVQYDSPNYYADVDSPSIRKPVSVMCKLDTLPDPMSHAVLEPTK